MSVPPEDGNGERPKMTGINGTCAA